MNADMLQSLPDERDIERALYRAARAMDDHDWETLAAVIAEDAVGDLGTGRLNGGAAIIRVTRDFLDSCGPTQHLLGNVVVDVTGDTAVSRAYVHDLHLSTDLSQRFYTIGEYRDTWQRRGDRWRIVERVKANRAYVGSIEAVFGG
jgi:3-phenylpropionate/cinnamic acid dioxygenase small subunit